MPLWNCYCSDGLNMFARIVFYRERRELYPRMGWNSIRMDRLSRYTVVGEEGWLWHDFFATEGKMASRMRERCIEMNDFREHFEGRLRLGKASAFQLRDQDPDD